MFRKFIITVICCLSIFALSAVPSFAATMSDKEMAIEQISLCWQTSTNKKNVISFDSLTSLCADLNRNGYPCEIRFVSALNGYAILGMMCDGRLIIDEAGLEYDNRKMAMTTDEIYFFKYHRHYQLDVDFFSQGLDVDIKIRKLARHIYLIKPSLLPFFIKRKEIGRRVGINDMTIVYKCFAWLCQRPSICWVMGDHQAPPFRFFLEFLVVVASTPAAILYPVSEIVEVYGFMRNGGYYFFFGPL